MMLIFYPDHGFARMKGFTGLSCVYAQTSELQYVKFVSSVKICDPDKKVVATCTSLLIASCRFQPADVSFYGLIKN
jgi:hypothetical protein